MVWIRKPFPPFWSHLHAFFIGNTSRLFTVHCGRLLAGHVIGPCAAAAFTLESVDACVTLKHTNKTYATNVAKVFVFI